jgi:hypothetical protein
LFRDVAEIIGRITASTACRARAPGEIREFDLQRIERLGNTWRGNNEIWETVFSNFQGLLPAVNVEI